MYDKITTLYCQYSRDDGQESENASITHQKKLLKIMVIPIFTTMLMTDIQARILTDLIFSVCLMTLKTV